MDNVTKALALARLGIKVFPVATATRAPLLSSKDGGRGFYDATCDDFELIATWFTIDFPREDTVEVGYWAGGSDLFVLDLDRNKPNGKDGFKSIAARGLDTDLGNTHAYPTKSGGEHRVFQTDRLDLTLSRDYDGLEGVDVRAGGSYAVWWADEVPTSRDVFSTDIPEWMTKVTEAAEFAGAGFESTRSEPAAFVGEGFSGSVQDWLDAIPDDDVMPSGKVRDLIVRIPESDFGHHEMVELAWAAVRLGSERETGIKMALNKLRAAWLREPYDTPEYRRDFDLALRGAIKKGGRVQNPAPPNMPLVTAMARADALGVGTDMRAIEHAVTGSYTEIDFARARREMFKIAASAGLTPSEALGIVTNSKPFKRSVATIDSAWFGDGEPEYHDSAAAEEESEAAELEKIEEEIAAARKITTLSADAAAFSFLNPAERAVAESYEWWGKDYLAFVEDRLPHYNKPYHVSAMWAALSLIVSPWGKLKAQGGEPQNCNLYIGAFGQSTSGKSESLKFGVSMIDAFYSVEDGPIIGDINKLSALALHRMLILRDGKPSFVYGDEIQSFFQGVQTSQWQNGILGDISSHYGGDVTPKITLNDKEVSGKRAKTLFTTYLTGIDTQTLDALSINHWTSGLLYRFLWSFGEPRKPNTFKVEFTSPSKVGYKEQFEDWAREFRRLQSWQEMKWGPDREVDWDADAHARINEFTRQIDDAVRSSPIYDEVYVSANVRFLTSILKCATLIALSQAAEKVSLEHVLVAIHYAGPWHRSMVLAVSETAKEPFERDVEKCLIWIRRNAVRQVGRKPYIQRSVVMKAFKPNEIADRLLRQLTEEGDLIKTGDIYQLSEG